MDCNKPNLKEEEIYKFNREIQDNLMKNKPWVEELVFKLK